MKKIGIVGGLAWPSTIDYYRAICRLSVAHHADQNFSGPSPVPEMVIESLNINKSFGLRGGPVTDNDSWAAYDKYFHEALKRLEKSGAELAIIASSTPHNRFSAITRGINIPVLSLFEAVAQECIRLGVRELLILGTTPTMELPVFVDVLAGHEIYACAPQHSNDRKKIVALISDLYENRTEKIAEQIEKIAKNSLPATEHQRAVCLACTELPLAFPNIEKENSLTIAGIKYINSTMVHARAAFAASTNSQNQSAI